MDNPPDPQRESGLAILSETLNRSIAQGGAHEPGDVQVWLAAIAQERARTGN